MATGQEIVFGSYRLDPRTQQLWQGEVLIELQARPLAVLQYLAERPGEVVTKKELLKAVWAGTYVTTAALKVAIREIRKALGEDAATPHYIETIRQTGYRFLGDGIAAAGPARNRQNTPARESFTVGRESEVAQLHRALQKALQGDRQLVFVTGEAGVGKTSIVNLFQEQVRASGYITLGHGQCVEQYSEGEGYLPFLEALGRLCREAGGPQLIALLRRYAPTWLVQLSGVLEEPDFTTLRARVQGSTQQRMLRELAEAVEVGTARHPLVLIFEDLHWSDRSTLELLSYLAQRREQARLCIIGTYRPVDAVRSSHPVKSVKQELQAKGCCEELNVALLTEEHVREYLAGQFADSELAAHLAPAIYHRTEGHALFLVNFVEELVQQGIVVQEGDHWIVRGSVDDIAAPENVYALISQQISHLSPDTRRLLEAASVGGIEFSATELAAALTRDGEAVEELCEEAVEQGQFIAEAGLAEWPDGTVSGQYQFRHAVYQEVLYNGLPETRRSRWHRLIGERIEAGYGEQASERAGDLSVHCERGRDYPRAVQYLQQAGQRAVQRSANVEAIAHLTRGVELLKELPNTPARLHQELQLQLQLGTAYLMAGNMIEVSRPFNRAHALCQQLGDTPQLIPALLGLFRFYLGQPDYHTARQLAEQLLRLGERGHDAATLLQAHYALGSCLHFLGEEELAYTHLEQGIRCYDPEQHGTLMFRAGVDPGVACVCWAANVLWLLGYPDQALTRSQEALAKAQALAHPFTQAYALWMSIAPLIYRREAPAVQKRAEQTIALCQEQEIALILPMAMLTRGWALAEQNQVEKGISAIQQSMTSLRAQGAEMAWTTWHALLAQAYMTGGRIEEGLTAVAEGLRLAERNEERYWEAELYRLRGELLFNDERRTMKNERRAHKDKARSMQRAAEAEECLQQAIAIARQQRTQSWELRASVSLARLWKDQGRQAEAYQLLSECYNWFTEGFETKDLQEAKALLETLD